MPVDTSLWNRWQDFRNLTYANGFQIQLQRFRHNAKDDSELKVGQRSSFNTPVVKRRGFPKDAFYMTAGTGSYWLLVDLSC